MSNNNAQIIKWIGVVCMHVFVLVIILCAIWGAVEIVRICVKFAENAERMKRGYPLKDGTMPVGYSKKDKKDKKDGKDDELSQVLDSTRLQ